MGKLKINYLHFLMNSLTKDTAQQTESLKKSHSLDMEVTRNKTIL